MHVTNIQLTFSRFIWDTWLPCKESGAAWCPSWHSTNNVSTARQWT